MAAQQISAEQFTFHVNQDAEGVGDVLDCLADLLIELDEGEEGGSLEHEANGTRERLE